MSEWWSWPLFVGLLLSAVGALWAFLNRKGSESYDSRTLRPPTWPEVWARIDAQDARLEEQSQQIEDQSEQIETLKKEFANQTGAIKRLLRSIAAQWPKGVAAPVLDQKDIDALSGVVPPHWLNGQSSGEKSSA